MAMKANISYWLRAFRPRFQQAYANLDETPGTGIGREFAELLRRADERRRQRPPGTDDHEPSRR
jgi:hypothetical protein